MEKTWFEEQEGATMILKAKVENGKLAFEEPLDLPEGTEITVDLELRQEKTNITSRSLG